MEEHADTARLRGKYEETEQTDVEAERLARVDAFGQSLARTRAEAISARGASGIETIWREDEEFYEGVDGMNRGEHPDTWRAKPPGQTTGMSDKDNTRSAVFPNITGPFCDAASARIADMLLPTDDRSWALKPTPVPELVDISQGKMPTDMVRQAVAENNQDPRMAMAQMDAAKEEAERIVEEANAKARKAEKRIEDWHVHCQWHAQVRLVIEDAARIGTAVLKGPVPMLNKTVAMRQPEELGDGVSVLQVVEEIKPGSKWIDPWNFYPDGSCRENIHNGAYTWERDYLTQKQLRELIGQPGYIREQIEQVLKEGPQSITGEYKETPDPVTDPSMKRQYQIWYFHGTAEREDLEAAGCDCSGETDPHVAVLVTMVNNRVIRAAMNPLDNGEFPYDVFVWRRRAGHWTGSGVARQIRVAQKIVTAATRNLMDNAGIAAGPMIVFRQGVVRPADGVARIAPRKVWMIQEDADEVNDARTAIGTIKIDMMVAELMQIIQLGLRFAEDVTGLPMLLQGQMGRAPDTVGGMQLLHNNASAVLRRLARLFDDRITEPHVRRYYAWLLQYGEDSEKGDFEIDARGSSALVERDIQNQELVQMSALVLDPRFGKDPKKWMDEYLKSRKFDPKRFDYDDSEWQQLVEQLSQGPQDHTLQIAQLKAETEQFKKEFDEKIQQAEWQFEAEENEKDRALEVALKELDGHIAGLKEASAEGMNTDKIKSSLAETVMKLRTQLKMADQKGAVPQVIAPAVEPLGRAPDGQAFQR